MSCASYFLPLSRNDEKSRGEIDDDGGPRGREKKKRKGFIAGHNSYLEQKEGERKRGRGRPFLPLLMAAEHADIRS